jgi:hypothetical protein
MRTIATQGGFLTAGIRPGGRGADGTTASDPATRLQARGLKSSDGNARRGSRREEAGRRINRIAASDSLPVIVDQPEVAGIVLDRGEEQPAASTSHRHAFEGCLADLGYRFGFAGRKTVEQNRRVV